MDRQLSIEFCPVEIRLDSGTLEQVRRQRIPQNA